MTRSRKTSLWALVALIAGLVLALGLGGAGAGPSAQEPDGRDGSFQTTLLSPVEDTTLNSWFPNNNYAAQGSLVLRSGDVAAPLLRFDLSPISSQGQVTIAAATLRLYVESRTNAQPLSGAPAKVNHNWVASQATWNKADSSTNWGMAGCNAVPADRDAYDPTAIVTLPPAGWVDFDVTAMAQDWLQDPASNYGVIIKSLDGSAVGYTLASVNNANTAVRPALRVVWGQVATPQPTTPAPTLTPSPTPLPFVQVEKLGPAGPLVSGVPTQITYTVVVTNPWSGTITNVEVKDVLPLGTVFISCTGNGEYNAENRSVTWKIPSMAAGTSLTFEIIAELETYVKDGIIINLVQAVCDGCSGRARDHWPIAVVLPTTTPPTPTDTPTQTPEATITPTLTPTAWVMQLVLIFKGFVISQ